VFGLNGRLVTLFVVAIVSVLAVARVADILLRPLLEGLALFCEHDLTTGDCRVISRVTQRVAPLFSKGRIQSLLNLAALFGGPDRAFSVGHTTILQEARKSIEWRERKALLLEQPIAADNGYLLGYLAVKGMHADLAGRCPALFDPELFFITVVHHFMDDHPLTEILLRFRDKMTEPADAYLSLGEDVGDLFTRFQDLCDELYANTAKIASTAMEYATETTAPRQPDGHTQLLMGLRTTGTFNIAWPRLMKHRLDFRFSFQDVIIYLKRDGEALVLDRTTRQEICRVTAVSGFRPVQWDANDEHIEFEGSIEAVHLRDVRTSVICVLGHYGLIAVFDCEKQQWNLPDQVEMLDDMPSAVAVEGAMHAFAEWQSRTNDRDGIHQVIEHYEQQARDAVDLLYPQLMCNGWVTERRKRLVDALKERGVFSLYEETDERRVSELSLAAGVGSLLENVALNMGLEAAELTDLVLCLNEKSKSRSGFEPFEMRGRFIRSRL
jgi:hypothetical protein